jgi:hypothetical protein
MTAFGDVNEHFAQLFADTWTPTGFPFQLENEKFDPPQGGTWARMVVRHNASTQSTLGQSPNRKFDRFGSLIMSIFTPIQGGTRASKDLVDRIMDGFEGVRIAGTTICFLDVIPREIGPSGDYYMTNVEAEFRWTETK